MISIDEISLSFDCDCLEVEDIKRCLSTLYSTREGSQPLDRSFGLSCSFVGKPIPVAQNELALEVVEKTEKYEPRVTVTEVTYKYNAAEGKIYATVHLEKGDDDTDE